MKEEKVKKEIKEEPKKEIKEVTAPMNLLDDDFLEPNNVQCKSASDYPSNIEEIGGNDEFGEFVSGNENISTERN